MATNNETKNEQSNQKKGEKDNGPLTVMSGMRPTGQLHLGHWEGALKNWVELQKKHQVLFFNRGLARTYHRLR